MIALLHGPVNGVEDGFAVANIRNVAKFEGGGLFHAGGGMIGVMECWSDGVLVYYVIPITPLLQYSITPIFFIV